MSLDRLALNALSRLDQASGKAEKGGRRGADRLPPGRHRVLFHTAPLAILLVDGHGHILEANHEATRLSRWSRAELRRTTLNALVRPEGRSRAETGSRSWQGLLHAGDGAKFEVRVQQGPPLGDTEGLRPLYLADLGREREERERIRAGDRAETVAGFAHGLALELANRMTALVGHVEMLGEALDAEGAARERFVDARRSIEGLDALTRELAVLGRVEKPRVELVDLAAYLQGLQPRLRDVFAPGISLELDVPAGTAAVTADPRLLERALLHLAQQAARAMPRGGLFGILAVAGGDGPCTEIEVRDTGAPLVRDGERRAFVPFAALRSDGRDAGLDLAIAHGLLVRSGVPIRADEKVVDGLALRLTFRKAGGA